MANQSRLPLINGAQEIDGGIKYKTKVIKYVSLLDTLYNNQFKEYIKILDSKRSNRFERSSELLLPLLKELDEAGKSCLEASDKIRSKYKITITDKTS